MSKRIVEIDITKGMAGFLMIMAHIAGKNQKPAQNQPGACKSANFDRTDKAGE